MTPHLRDSWTVRERIQAYFRLWIELHAFERVGMVTQWLQQAGFENLQTFFSFGWPLPEYDHHAGETPHSDSVYAAWALKPKIDRHSKSHQSV